MNVITFASRNAGAGKSTLAAHLAVAAIASGCRCLLIDADPSHALTTWHARRLHDAPAVKKAGRGIKQALAAARLEGFDWVFIDAPSSQWLVMSEAIRAATLVVIPARPSRFDLTAVRVAVNAARERSKPYAVVLNAAPARPGDEEPAAVAAARAQLGRLHIPVWPGQITQRTGLAIALATGASPLEAAPDSAPAVELAGLWSAIARSVAAVNRTSKRLDGSHSHDIHAYAA